MHLEQTVHRPPEGEKTLLQIGGAASLIAGLAMYFRVPGFPAWISVPFAIVISVYMVIAGWILLTQAGAPEPRRSLERGVA